MEHDMVPMTEASLRARELDLEEQAIGLGAARYYAALEHGEERTPPGLALMRKMIPDLAKAIGEWVQDAKDGHASRAAGVALFAGQFAPEDVAFITAREVIASISDGTRVARVAFAIARVLEDASMSEALHKADEKGWKRLNTKVEKCPFPGKRYILVKKALGKASIQRISWGKSEKLRLGMALLGMCAETSAMFDIVMTERRGTKTFAFLKARPDTAEWLNLAHQRCSLQAPHYLPMIVPPTPWRSLRGGGYVSKALPLRLITTKRLNRGYEEELRNRDMPMVYSALNAIQETPWRVNKGVLRVLKEVWDAGGSIGGIPAANDEPLPLPPWGDGAPPSRDEPIAKEHFAKYARTAERNEKRAGYRRAMSIKVLIADQFQSFERIYYPHCLDWRGRIYPVVPHLNPQSDDSGKALLEFADGKPLGEDGAFWLAVHGANCYGIDKVPFAERLQWVEDHQEQILDSALNPINGTRFWCDAEGDKGGAPGELTTDNPWMFLAFCMEWAGLVMHVSNGGAQEDFVSYLPVSFDGSCNGLQNFSAMLRDPVGGLATNLVPQDRPNDIYARVAEVASKQVEADAARGEINATYWLGKVDRKVAKRPTMTLPYGSGQYGFRDQLRAMLKKYQDDHGKAYLLGDEFLCSMYMANVMYESLGQVVVAARSAMDWLKEVSKVVAREGLPIWWTTPAGFQVMQDYREYMGKQISFHAAGKRLRLTVLIESDKLDKRKQAQGISPNFVHSLDAAHLMRTVAGCMEYDIHHFAMIHDSYGTHAGNASTLNRVLREAFVTQYSANVLEDFREQIMEQVSEKHRHEVPPVPPMGTLDLEGVKQSEYFFA